MKLLKNIWFNVHIKLLEIKHLLEVRKYKKLYPDYEDDMFNCGPMKHIWGIKSYDDLTIGSDAHFYSMNDLDITYDRKTEEYWLGIETIYMFKDRQSEQNYLKNLLNDFTKFMIDNGYSIDFDYNLFCNGVGLDTKAKSIEELYKKFEMFVRGYLAIYDNK